MAELERVILKVCECLGFKREVEEPVPEKREIEEIREEQEGKPVETTLLYVNSLKMITAESVKKSIDKGLTGNVEIVKDIVGDIKDKLSKKEWKHLQDRVYRTKLVLGEEK